MYSFLGFSWDGRASDEIEKLKILLKNHAKTNSGECIINAILDVLIIDIVIYSRNTQNSVAAKRTFPNSRGEDDHKN